MKRQATYTAEVPIKFSFLADNELSGDELFEVAKKELMKVLASGYFDVETKRVEVVDKVTHYTKEEKEAQNKMWAEIFRRPQTTIEINIGGIR